MVLKRVCKVIATTFILATVASLALGCATTDADKAAGSSVKDPQTLPVTSAPADGQGLYPEDRDKGVIKELERAQEKKQ